MTVKEKILENLIKEEAFKFRQKLIEENEVRLDELYLKMKRFPDTEEIKKEFLETSNSLSHLKVASFQDFLETNIEKIKTI